MKNIFYLIILVLITTSRDIKSQEINPLNFFPHHIGDLWQYITYTQVGNEFTQLEITSIDTSYIDSSITITKFNGNQELYFKIYFNDTLTIYQNTPSGWGILYDLDAEINAYWLSDPFSQLYTKYIGESEALVFEDTLLSREYWICPDTLFVLPISIDNSALGIGYYYGEFEGGIIVLNGCIINGVQYGTIVNVGDKNENVLFSDYILNNFPNPFNSQTTINFYLPVSTFILLNIYDILGRKVKQLFEGERQAGTHYQLWIPDKESSGIYFVVMRTNNELLTHKILYLR